MRLALSERELFAVNAEQVRVFRFDGSQQRSWNLNLKFVSSIAVHENELFVLGSSEFGLTVVRVYHTSGSFTRHFTLPRFHPTTMAVSASHIVLADSDARRILVLGHDGVKIGLVLVPLLPWSSEIWAMFYLGRELIRSITFCVIRHMAIFKACGQQKSR